MAVLTEAIVKKSFRSPDEVREAQLTRIEMLNLGENVIAKTTLQPGWRWSTHLKPTMGTDLCQVEHLGYCLSGRLHVMLADGSEQDIVPDDLVRIPPEHDAWVVGNEPFVFLDFTGGKSFSKR